MTVKALVVEDNPQIVEVIEDSLDSVGHTYRLATNQADARAQLETEEFSYVLLDLEIPAKPKRGLVAKEHGVHTLEDIQRIKGPGKLPVIIMTAHVPYCLNNSNELRGKGATEFIAKPFPTEGRTLASVARHVLRNHEQQTAVRDCGSGLGPFQGGELIFHPDRIELLGIRIVSDRGAGQAMLVLAQLRRRDLWGKYVCLSAEELVRAINAMGGIGTITGCIRLLRNNITTAPTKTTPY